MEEINDEFERGATSMNSEVDLVQLEVAEEFLYYPNKLTVPNKFRHKADLIPCYAAPFDEAMLSQISDLFEYSCIESGPGSAVVTYKSVDSHVFLRILMHRIPYLVQKLQSRSSGTI